MRIVLANGSGRLIMGLANAVSKYPATTPYTSVADVVMLCFVCFVIVHEALVLTTGVLRNLNHMYASTDGACCVGFWIFAASLAVMVAAWFLARPVFLGPVASLTGKVSK